MTTSSNSAAYAFLTSIDLDGGQSPPKDVRGSDYFDDNLLDEYTPASDVSRFSDFRTPVHGERGPYDSPSRFQYSGRVDGYDVAEYEDDSHTRSTHQAAVDFLDSISMSGTDPRDSIEVDHKWTSSSERGVTAGTSAASSRAQTAPGYAIMRSETPADDFALDETQDIPSKRGAGRGRFAAAARVVIATSKFSRAAHRDDKMSPERSMPLSPLAQSALTKPNSEVSAPVVAPEPIVQAAVVPGNVTPKRPSLLTAALTGAASSPLSSRTSSELTTTLTLTTTTVVEKVDVAGPAVTSSETVQVHESRQHTGPDAAPVSANTSKRKKLHGPIETTKLMPEQMRLASDKLTESLADTPLLFTTATTKAVYAISSVLRYKNPEKEEKAKKLQSNPAMQVDALLAMLGEANATHDDGEAGMLQRLLRKRIVSFETLLSKHDEEENEEHGAYDPLFLDDPGLHAGKHRTVMTLPGFIGSILPYVRPDGLKQELNDQFRAAHEWLEGSGLTLSKIRNVKKSLLAVSKDAKLDLDVSTVALAIVYFEKLVLKKVVNKFNRKLVAGACLLLAVKFNEAKGREREFVRLLLSEIEDELHVSRADVLGAEFSVFALLNFNISAEPRETIPHIHRLLQMLDRAPEEYYFGEDTLMLYSGVGLRYAGQEGN